MRRPGEGTFPIVNLQQAKKKISKVKVVIAVIVAKRANNSQFSSLSSPLPDHRTELL